ncbi:MAG: exodeoxyribonuclease VII large subunit [Acutalibacteraceae bacterium]|nr:exodeoxyribonuclease VII large subunit [Acutalibacteraceae bacterium]
MFEVSVLSVSQLNTYVKSILDSDLLLQNVFVVGEISNFTNHYRTGHYYMTLKDENSCIKAVMFRSANQRLKFMPESGMNVIVRGRVSLYDRDGQYQLYIDDMQPDGIGALNLAFEQLKNKLAQEGLFDESNKKPIPYRNKRIGVVTSATGAVIQDIINVISRRYPLAEIILAPVEVQGENAAPQISAAIDRFNLCDDIDVLIVGRGGGSLEDLWAFNEEIVARAVFRSRIPVISAVGHETDFTICDFVADLRAPTPSAAAELAVPDIKDDKAFVSSVPVNAEFSVRKMIAGEQEKLSLIRDKLRLLSPSNVIDDRLNTVSLLYAKALNLIELRLGDESNRFAVACAKLDSLNPIKVLSRGYSITLKDTKIVSSVSDITRGDRVTIKLADGEKECEVL